MTRDCWYAVVVGALFGALGGYVGDVLWSALICSAAAGVIIALPKALPQPKNSACP